MKQLLTIALLASTAFGAEGYKILTKYPIGGTGGWDYVAVDSANRRIYASHATLVEVLDADSGKVVGQIKDLHGVHGIAVAADLNKGFITNGQSDSVTVFNLKTLEKMGEPAVGGKNPDAVCYEPKTKRVFAMNHTGNNATAIDATNNQIVATFPLGPAPEFCAVDGAGKVYVNVESSSEVLEIDAAKPAVTRRVELTPNQSPSGLAIDVKGKKLFAVCADSKTMAVVDIPSFKVVASLPIGPGTDAAGYDPGTGLAFSSNGGDGTLTIVHQANGKYEVSENVTTEPRARTMAVDEKTHKIYLLAAEYGAPVEGKDGKKRPQVVPNSFHVLVVGK